MDHSENFLTLEQIAKLIELPVSNIREMLSSFVYFKGLVYGHGHKIIYVDGYYIIEQTELGYDIYNREDLERIENSGLDVTEVIISIKGCEFSNNYDLIDVEVSLKNSLEIDAILYSYKQLCEIMKNLGAPEPKSINELSKKEYAYDVELLNQKSNYTLEQACRIAANLPLEEIYPYQQQPIGTLKLILPPLVSHYQEVISECVKGQNQHEFHLITQELWVHSHDYDQNEPCSRRFDNGTKLVVSANVNLELTLISKSEFLRWCKYMDIDTGLNNYQKNCGESIEALKAENEKLKKQRRPTQQLPPSMLNKNKNNNNNNNNNNNEEIERLNTVIKSLTDEVELLKGNSFSVMTSKLKVILATQNKYWISYDNMNLPTQQEISNFIAEKLNLTVTAKGTNRTADELAKAIQPDEIKRK